MGLVPLVNTQVPRSYAADGATACTRVAEAESSDCDDSGVLVESDSNSGPSECPTTVTAAHVGTAREAT